MEYKYNKYICTCTTLKKTINKYGVAIIPKVLDKKEINNMNSGVWDYLENTSKEFVLPIKQNDKSTWREFYKLYPKHSMLMQHFGIGHAQYVWDIRQNPKVVNVFSKLWNVKPFELVTSFDGASFHLPPEITNKGFYRGKQWLHSDQSFTRNDFECVQSWITGYDVNEYDATLTFLEGSNNYHKDVSKKFNITDKGDWHIITNDEMNYYKKKGCNQYCIKCKAGDMVCWDSRTIHSGIESQKRTKMNFRNIVYACMSPRCNVEESQLKKKRNAFTKLRTTNHYPNKVKLFSINPRTYGSPIEKMTPVPIPKLTKLGLSLAGF